MAVRRKQSLYILMTTLYVGLGHLRESEVSLSIVNSTFAAKLVTT